MPATSDAEQAKADLYLEQLTRRAAFRRRMAALFRGDPEARRRLGQDWLPLESTPGNGS